jgi:hypothetical protein
LKGRCACLEGLLPFPSKGLYLALLSIAFAIGGPLPDLCHQTNLAFGFDMEGPLPLKRLFHCLPFCVRGAIVLKAATLNI